MTKVNIFYNYDEVTGDEEVKVLNVPDKIVNTINDNYAEYIKFLVSLRTSEKRTKKESDKIEELLTKYKESQWELEKFIFDAISLSPCNDDDMSGYYLVEDAETEISLLEY